MRWWQGLGWAPGGVPGGREVPLRGGGGAEPGLVRE